MSEPTPIPLPSVLDPDRGHLLGSENAAADPEAQLKQLKQALDDSCRYGQQLWQALDGQRGYLLHSLPPDPRTPGLHRTTAAPTGPDDEDGWQSWMAAYADAHSALAGPQGDSGFGISEAQREAQNRRTAPSVRLLADHPELRSTPAVGKIRVRSRIPEMLGVAAVTLAARALLVRQLHRR